MSGSVICPKCSRSTTAYFCDCGKDLRELFPDAIKATQRPKKASGQFANIGEFLMSVGLESYTESFKTNDITMEMLPSLTDDDLKSLGVESLGHRRKLIEATGKLHGAWKPEPQPQVFISVPSYAQQTPTTPGIVIAGFVLALFFPLVGFILCIVGMPEAERRGAGVGLARAGIAIGGLFSFVIGPIVYLAIYG